ncbi:hypothetical protein H7H51_13530 [Mycolicibacterium farcinogenes]|nr:hypothetical protein [Mycolicibacterium farcinogenes]
MGVVESADRLFERLSAVGDEFTRYLRPGLSTERMDDLLGRAGLPQPPSDVREFYGAFDLVPGYQYELDQPSFYGIYCLLSFEDALTEWDYRRSNEYAEPPWQDVCPFLQEDGNGFLVETQADENGNHRVIHDFLGEIPAQCSRTWPRCSTPSPSGCPLGRYQSLMDEFPASTRATSGTFTRSRPA